MTIVIRPDPQQAAGVSVTPVYVGDFYTGKVEVEFTFNGGADRVAIQFGQAQWELLRGFIKAGAV